mmetsp:Transcript_764/g.2215  ORF Transcript_764/g.2215 Transcript_764/m.2215 type:complete len:99 (-) Transcript_764:3449-3745(-)
MISFESVDGTSSKQKERFAYWVRKLSQELVIWKLATETSSITEIHVKKSLTPASDRVGNSVGANVGGGYGTAQEQPSMYSDNVALSKSKGDAVVLHKL